MGPEAAGVTATGPDDARGGANGDAMTASGWRPVRPLPMPADDGRFLLDHALGRFCNPFHRIRSEDELYDGTMDRVTGAPLSPADFAALESGADAPDDLQRRLGLFLADCLVDDFAADFRAATAAASSDSSPDQSDASHAFAQARRIRACNPFAPRLSPELQSDLIRRAAARSGVALSSDDLAVRPDESEPEQRPIPRPKPEHEARFRQRIDNLRALRDLNMRARPARAFSVLVVGAGPAGLIRAISAVLQGLETVVLESRPQDGTKRPQIVVIRSRAVIALLERLGVIDFLFKEDLIFPLGRLQLEASLAGLERAFQAVLRLVTADDPNDDAACPIVHHETVIEHIGLDHGLARVTARGPDRQVLSFSPHLIVIADGRRSPTAALLGIPRRDPFYSHTGIIAIFRPDGQGLSRPRQAFGALWSKLNYAFHRHVSGRGAGLLAGTILQVPGHHYLGLDLAPDEEMRLRDAIKRANEAQAGAEDKLKRLLRFWAAYGFEAIRTHPRGSAPHTGGRPIPWLPLDPKFTMPIEVVSDRAGDFCGSIGKTFVMIEGDAQFTIHPGSAYGCAKAFLSANLFDFLLRARLSRPEQHDDHLSDSAFALNAELMARAGNTITRLFRVTA